MKSPQPDHDDLILQPKLRHRPFARASILRAFERLACFKTVSSGAEGLTALVVDAVSGLRFRKIAGVANVFMDWASLDACVGVSMASRLPARVAGNTSGLNHQASPA